MCVAVGIVGQTSLQEPTMPFERTLSILAIAVLTSAAHAATPGTPASTTPLQSTASSQSCGIQAQLTQELEKELDRDRALIQDLQQQITAQRLNAGASATDISAGAGDPEALNAAGLERYRNGDAEGAVSAFRKAIDAGSTPAMVSLALLYLDGKGVSQDPKQAIALLERAAGRGSVDAANNLGEIFERGLGVSFNRDHAIAWYQKAEQLGSRVAAPHIASLRALPLR
jgi:TPR repeat protein